MAETFTDKPDQYLTLDFLDTPKDANFWISGRCNFACRYCLHGAKKEDSARAGLKKEMLTWDRFVRMADDLGRFKEQVVSASFCGIGEPTLHPQLPEMIAYLKKNKLVKYVEVTTNGSLLTKELSLRLIRAGTDYLTVSIQGVSVEDYRRVCGNPADPLQIAEQVRWFHDHAFGGTVHVRTLDYALPGKDERERFCRMFEGCCDRLTIAGAVKMFQGMDYAGVVDREVDQYTGEEITRADFCPLVFSSIHLLPDGGISACPLPEGPEILGNIDRTSLKEAWNSPQRMKLLLAHAQCRRDSIPACASCREPDMLVGSSKMPQELAQKIAGMVSGSR